RGGETEARRIDALMVRLDDLQAEIARLETQIAEHRRKTAGRSRNVPTGYGEERQENAGDTEPQVRET
ncbi:MAG TPA: hypothetical protein VIM84_12500, partial [Gemmatimonadales bacterium]